MCVCVCVRISSIPLIEQTLISNPMSCCVLRCAGGDTRSFSVVGVGVVGRGLDGGILPCRGRSKALMFDEPFLLGRKRQSEQTDQRKPQKLHTHT